MIFKFNQSMSEDQCDETLEQQICQTELGALLLKTVTAYLQCVRAQTASVWTFCPEECRDNRDELRASTNIMDQFMEYMFEFGTSDGKLVRDQDAFVSVDVLKQCFKHFKEATQTKGTYDIVNHTHYTRLGCRVQKKNICISCKGLHLSNCCAAYSRTARTCKQCVLGLALTPPQTTAFL
jgi:hypothetical protein